MHGWAEGEGIHACGSSNYFVSKVFIMIITQARNRTESAIIFSFKMKKNKLQREYMNQIN